MSNPTVLLETTSGDILIELFPDKAPDTVANFLQYVDDGFYANTIFHRVIPGFMIQGGGLGPRMDERPPAPPSRTKPTTVFPMTAAPSPWPAPWIPTAPPPSSSSTWWTTIS